MNKQTASQQEALEQLRKLLPVGKRVLCVLRGVSRSGMSRNIDFYTIDNDSMIWLTGHMNAAGIVKQSRKDWEQSKGVKIQGCGMDMGFHVVYNMGRVLYPDGFIPADAGLTYGRNGSLPTERDNDGGYALQSEWI